MKSLSPLACLAALLLAACGHTNNLAKYNISGKSAIYRTTMAADAASALTIIEPPNDNTAIGIATTIGSVIVGSEAQKKLERALNPDSLAQSVGLGMRQATSDYLNIRAVNDWTENPDLIIETTLTDCKLLSSSIGLAIKVRGDSRVIERGTGRLIWENSESHVVPLSETYLAGLAPRPVASGASIFNAIQLLNLSSEEIRKVVNSAATEAGREIGETLRQDVADLHK
ncbi:MAG: hypothetical protein JST22_08305 [Bacteroidetes bacterium]|nr:hypothetical protein [Bacteroidota bacterium]